MPYEDWWPPIHLRKMSNYYHMFCTPGRVFAKGGVSRKPKYDFEMPESQIRGYGYYRQRYWKGVGYGYRMYKRWGVQ